MSKAPEPPPTANEQQGVVSQLWRHPWGRVLMAAMTIAVVFWALRETAILTTPIVRAAGDILLPLAIGFTIAYILSPLVDALARRARLPRLLSTGILFSCMSLLVVLVLSLVVPAIVRQSADLSHRLVSEFYYIDSADDGRFTRGDIRVLPLPGQPGWFFQDLDGDGQWSPEEPRFGRVAARIRLEPSLMGKFSDWVERQSSALRQVVGVDLDEQSLAELAFYDQETRSLLQMVDQALEWAREEMPAEQWSDEFQTLAEQPAPPTDLLWPGILRGEAETLAEGYDAETRRRWLHGMRHLARRYQQRHAEIVQVLADGRSNDGAETALAQRLRVTVRQDLPDEQRRRLRNLQQRLMRSEGGVHGTYARDLMQFLRGQSDPDNSILRDIALKVDEAISGELGGVAGAIGGWLRQVLSNVPALLSFALNVVLIPIYAFFLTLAMPHMRRAGRRMVDSYGGERSLRIVHAIERVVAAFFRGRLIVCALCAILIYLGFLPLSVPYAALFAVLIGLATAIPLAGLLFLVPAVLLILVDGGGDVTLRVSLVIAVYTVVQTLEATVFTPMIMGREVELHPVTLIIALLFFGKLFGILGLILAVPIAATLRILWHEFITPRLKDRGIAATAAESNQSPAVAESAATKS